MTEAVRRGAVSSGILPHIRTYIASHYASNSFVRECRASASIRSVQLLCIVYARAAGPGCARPRVCDVCVCVSTVVAVACSVATWYACFFTSRSA